MNTKVDEGKLISGKEAYRLIGDGVEIEARVKLDKNVWVWEDAKHLPACDILNDGFDFRLKSRTISINGIEVPAPFEPKIGGVYFYLSGRFDCGYASTMREPLCARDSENIRNSAWRTEEEIKQVVAALRQVFGGSHE